MKEITPYFFQISTGLYTKLYYMSESSYGRTNDLSYMHTKR